MSKATKTKTQKTKAKRLVVDGGMKQAVTEDLVDDKGESEPTEGFLNVGNGTESEKPQRELKEPDYEKEEGSVKEDGKDDKKDGEESTAALASGLAVASGTCACTPRGETTTHSLTRLPRRATRSCAAPRSWWRWIQTSSGKKTPSS